MCHNQAEHVSLYLSRPLYSTIHPAHIQPLLISPSCSHSPSPSWASRWPTGRNTGSFTFYLSLTPTAQPLYSVTGLEPELPSAHLNTAVIECKAGAAVKHTIYDWTEENAKWKKEPIREGRLQLGLLLQFIGVDRTHTYLLTLFLFSTLISFLLCTRPLNIYLPPAAVTMAMLIHKQTYTLAYSL